MERLDIKLLKIRLKLLWRLEKEKKKWNEKKVKTILAMINEIDNLLKSYLKTKK